MTEFRIELLKNQPPSGPDQTAVNNDSLFILAVSSAALLYGAKTMWDGLNNACPMDRPKGW